ncbi:methyltransferase domain-containing protein [Candidatus Woesearchaeota archaeon]|nr:methyltransferase domain-containing protein [Candidatus Woesearchaeota archaeon]
MSSNIALDYSKDMNPKFFEIRVKIIRKLIREYKPKKVLDIGCGTGIFLDNFHNEFASGTGIDSSIDMVNFANRNHKRENIKYVLAKDTPLHFDNNSFDLVFSMGTLEYVKDQKNHIDEALRVLRKNGILFLTTPTKIMNIYNIARIAGLAVARYWKINRYLSFDELEDIVVKDSADIIEHKVLFFNPSSIRLLDILFNTVSKVASGKLNKYLLGPQYIVVRKRS